MHWRPEYSQKQCLSFIRDEMPLPPKLTHFSDGLNFDVAGVKISCADFRTFQSGRYLRRNWSQQGFWLSFQNTSLPQCDYDTRCFLMNRFARTIRTVFSAVRAISTRSGEGHTVEDNDIPSLGLGRSDVRLKMRQIFPDAAVSLINKGGRAVCLKATANEPDSE